MLAYLIKSIALSGREIVRRLNAIEQLQNLVFSRCSADGSNHN